jgi:hypothetical protein
VRAARVGLLAAAAAVLAGAGAYAWWQWRWHGDLSTVEMIERLPSQGAVVIDVDVSALRRSGILDLLAGSKPVEEPDYKHFVDQSGFNYRSDLDTVLLAFQSGSVYFVMRGRFDWDKLAQYAKAQGGQCERGRCVMPGSQPDRKISFFRLRQGVMAMAVSTDATADKGLLVRRPIDPAQPIPSAPMWAWIPVSTLKAEGVLPAGLRSYASAIEGAERVVMTLDAAGNRFELKLDVLCRSSTDATVAVAQLEAATGLLKKMIAREKMTPNPRDLSGVLTAGTFKREDRRAIGVWPIERVFLESITGGAR